MINWKRVARNSIIAALGITIITVFLAYQELKPKKLNDDKATAYMEQFLADVSEFKAHARINGRTSKLHVFYTPEGLFSYSISSDDKKVAKTFDDGYSIAWFRTCKADVTDPIWLIESDGTLRCSDGTFNESVIQIRVRGKNEKLEATL